MTEIRLEQQLKNVQSPYERFAFSTSFVDTFFIYFNRLILQDIGYRPQMYRGEWKFRYRENSQINGLEVRGLERSFNSELSLNYRGVFWLKSNLESEINYKRLKRISEYSSLRNRNIASWRFKNTIAWVIERQNFISLELTMMNDRQIGNRSIEAILNGIKLNYERKSTARGRWGAFLALDRVEANPKGSNIPWEMCNGRKEGITFGWGLSAEYSIGRNLTCRASYEGWNEPIFPVYHLGKAEVRAYF